VLLAACGDSTKDAAPLPTGTAITVGDTKISSAKLVSQLRIIAANKQLARVLKKEDDTALVPERGTIDEGMAQAWVNTLVNQVLVDRELARRKLKVTTKARRKARKEAATMFRGAAAFDAFPKSFKELATNQLARQDVLLASFPKVTEPPEAELRALFTQGQASCQGGKLISMIYVSKQQQADDLQAQLAAGADFATLARERSEDTTAAARDGVTMCIGSTRFNSSEDASGKPLRSRRSAYCRRPSVGKRLRDPPHPALTSERPHDPLAPTGAAPHPLYDYLAATPPDQHPVAKRFACHAGPGQRSIGPFGSRDAEGAGPAGPAPYPLPHVASADVDRAAMDRQLLDALGLAVGTRVAPRQVRQISLGVDLHRLSRVGPGAGRDRATGLRQLEADTLGADTIERRVARSWSPRSPSRWCGGSRRRSRPG
jgi:hypothetical protein